MSALGINITTIDPTYDYTGLVSGHIRPEKVHQADHDRLDAWADYQAICDLFEDGKVSLEIVNGAREVAQYIDGEYRRIYRVWQASLDECACHPIDADREYVCMSCRAKAELNGDAPMPY